MAAHGGQCKAEEDASPATYAGSGSMVVVFEGIVDALYGGAFGEGILPLLGSARDDSEQAGVVGGFGVDDPSVRVGGTGAITGVTFVRAAFGRAAPLDAVAVGAEPVMDHFTTGLANGDAVFINL